VSEEQGPAEQERLWIERYSLQGRAVCLCTLLSVGAGFWLGFSVLAELWPFDFPIVLPVLVASGGGLLAYATGRTLLRVLGVPFFAEWVPEEERVD